MTSMPLHPCFSSILLTTSLCASTLVGSLTRQDAVEPTTDLDELIERVEEYESFRATYRVLSSDGRIGLIRWTYLADDRARATLETAGESRDLFWIDGGTLSSGVFDSNGDPYVVGLELGAEMDAYREVNELLDERFPLDGVPPFEPHLQFSLVLNVEKDKTDMSMGIVDRRSSLFAWLPMLRSRERTEQNDPLVLAFDTDDRRYEVSALNGFITSAWIGAGEDRRLAAELVALELDVEIDAEEVRTPEWTGTDDAIDAGFRQAMLNTLRRNSRETVAIRLERLDEDGELDWSEAGPEGLLELLTELHVVATRYDTQKYLEHLEEQFATRVESLTEWADELREDVRMPEQLELYKQQARTELEATLQQILETSADRLESPSERELSIFDEFLKVERRALRAALETELRDMALERFDETVGTVE